MRRVHAFFHFRFAFVAEPEAVLPYARYIECTHMGPYVAGWRQGRDRDPVLAVAMPGALELA